MKCPICDQDNRDIALFCQYCGAALSPTFPPQQASEQKPDRDAIERAELPPASVEGQVPAVEAPEYESSADVQQSAEPSGAAAGGGEDAPAGEALQRRVLQSAAEGVASEEEPVDAASESVPVPETEIPLAEESVGQLALGEPCDGTKEQPGSAEELAHEDTPYGLPEQAPDQMAEETAVSEQEGLEIQSQELPGDAPAGMEDIPLLDAEVQEAGGPGQTEAAPVETPEGSHAQGDLLAAQEPTSADEQAWYSGPEAFPPLEPGTVVNGRYRIVEVLSEGDQRTLYQVRDLQRCARCGFAGNSPDEAFCASCGAVMDQKPVATMLERPLRAEHEPVDTQVEDHFAEGERTYWVWRELEATATAENTVRPLSLTIGQRSDTGQVRELDEDSLFVLTVAHTYESLTEQLALFVVADGMGGHEGGEVASRLAIQTLAEMLLHSVVAPEIKGSPVLPEAIPGWMTQAMQAANDRVYLERQKRESDMGTTMTAALIKGRTLYLAHVGDCRAYHWGEHGLQQLTTDHSIVASMVAAGKAHPEEIYTHPQRSVIYRCIGDQPAVEVDTSTHAVNPGDRLVLCCDGLWEMIRNEGIEDTMLRESDPQKACDTMVEQANLAGGTDNISVIVVQL